MTVQPNQSLLDVILQGCGSIQAGMQVAADNGMALSYMPAIGSEIVISAAALTIADPGTLQYIQQNGVVFGTKNLPDTAPLITEDGSEDLISEDSSSDLYPDEGSGIVSYPL